MAHVSTHLNFTRHTEEEFNFNRSVFGGEFGSEGISRFIYKYGVQWMFNYSTNYEPAS